MTPPELNAEAVRLCNKCILACLAEYIKGNQEARTKGYHNQEQVEAFADTAVDRSLLAIRKVLESADRDVMLYLFASDLAHKVVERVEEILKEHPESVAEHIERWEAKLREEEQQ